MIKIVSLSKSFWGSLLQRDEAPSRAGIASAIERGARADGARIASESDTVTQSIALENSYLADAAPYAVVRSQFYTALALILPLGLLIAASWQLTLFGLEIIPNESVRNVAALALVGATLLSIHILLHSLSRPGWVVLTLTALSVLVLADAHYQLAKTRAAVIADWILQGSTTVMESATGAALVEVDAASLASTLLPLLRALLPLMAVGLEIMAGVTLYFVLTALFDPALLAYWRVARLRRRAAHLSAEAAAAAGLAERADEEAQLTLDLGRNSKAFISKDALIAIVIAVVALLAISTNLFAAPAVDRNGGCKAESQRVALLIDLSKSRAAADVKADAAGVERVLSEAQPCSHYVVLGVGDDGWGAPIVLLDVKVTTNGGWMQQDLKIARRRLAASWTKTAASLAPTYAGSDVIGTMLYAIELLGLSSARPGTLINFTDGRQTRTINLESTPPLSPETAARQAKERGLVASIAGSRTFFLGASTAGRSPAYWNSLREFWKAWTALTGASFGSFSVGRDVCGLTALCTSRVVAATTAAVAAVPETPTPAPPRVPIMVRKPEHDTQSLAGSIGSSLQWASGWLELDSHVDFHRGDKLRLVAGGGARRVVVRLLSRSGDPNSADGVDGGVVDVPPGGAFELTLQRDHLATRQVSLHGGVSPFGLYRLGGGNGPAVLLSAERICAH